MKTKPTLQTVVIIETASKDKDDIRAASTILAITDSEIRALYARNPITVYKSICKRNKIKRRLVFYPEICTGLTLRLGTPVTSTNALIAPIYNMWPESRVKIVRTNQLTALQLFEWIKGYTGVRAYKDTHIACGTLNGRNVNRLGQIKQLICIWRKLRF